MAAVNESYLEMGKESIASALRAIARPGGLPALFHCSIGKDRTGLLAMMLLNLAGASDEEIAVDYKLTRDFVPIMPEDIEKAKNWMQMANVELDDEQARNVLASDPEVVHLTMAMIRQKYGSVHLYLSRGLGFSEDEILALRKALLTPLRTAPTRTTLLPINNLGWNI